MLITRPIVAKDLAHLVHMQQRHREDSTAYSKIKFDSKLCMENMALVLDNPDHLILVSHNEGEDRILGYVWLVKVQPHYSHNFYYAELYTYIVPDCRGGRVFMSLVNRASRISKLSGAEYLEYGSFNDISFSKALAKRYPCVGSVYRIPI